MTLMTARLCFNRNPMESFADKVSTKQILCDIILAKMQGEIGFLYCE
jgi:hypothetical protein